MRILHTSDWHIGHKLYERSRVEEHRKFLEWLLGIIKEEEIDLLLVAGDIFDTALPSAESTDLYYRFLFRLYEETNASAVIIAGNHDSAIRLAAPREFLKMGRIHVAGIFENIDECVVTLRKDDAAVAIAAVPYLAEGEILPHVSFEGDIERAARYREAVKRLYQDCVAKMPPEVPKILLGHLFVQGGKAGNSERTILVGGTMLTRVADFPEKVDYVALGHLHRPQEIKGREYAVMYSGSVLPLTFQEATYDKKLYIFDSDSRELEDITVPVFQELIRVAGSFNEILTTARSELNDWQGKYIEVQVRMETPIVGAGDMIRNAFAERGGEVLVVDAKLALQDGGGEISAEEISSKSPEEIFVEFYQSEYRDSSDEAMAEVMATFKELLVLSSGDERA